MQTMASPAQAQAKTRLHIRNMVCPRCIMAVKEILGNAGLEVLHVELGYAVVATPAQLDLATICKDLEAVGFGYIMQKDDITLEGIKVTVLEYIHQLEAGNHETLSAYLSRSLGINYTSLSRLYSKATHTTIQKYLVLQKIERVKELLDYGDLSLSEIAVRLGYSSVHYLSSQFRQVTGQSVSAYKQQRYPQRKFIDQL